MKQSNPWTDPLHDEGLIKRGLEATLETLVDEYLYHRGEIQKIRRRAAVLERVRIDMENSDD